MKCPNCKSRMNVTEKIRICPKCDLKQFLGASHHWYTPEKEKETVICNCSTPSHGEVVEGYVLCSSCNNVIRKEVKQKEFALFKGHVIEIVD